jgi:SpoVK/Ycf46/Vps4 family AAA+-type ATPase
MKFLLTTEIDSSIKDTEWNTIKCCKVDNPDVLTKDNFWISLSKEKYQLIILDDIDKLIVSRENQVFDSATRDKFMNKFLSFSDGLSKTKSKVILTTNINSNDVDPAMTRKGRTFDAFRFRPLTKEQAKNIWESYAIESELFEKEFVGKEVIYQSDLGSKIEFITNLKKHNFFRQKYCLDPSISILEDIQKSSDLAL